MVDRDKIKERTSGGGEKETASSSRQPSGGQSQGSSGSAEIELDSEAGGDTYSDKMEKLKGASGGSSSGGGSSGSGGVPRQQVGKVFEAISNILFYTEGKMRSYKDPSSRREVVETNVTTKIYEQFTDIVAESNVQAICEKYGIDWEEDVLQPVIAEQDFDEDYEMANDMSASVVNVGSGSDFKKEHFHQVLLALGKMFLFVKTLEEKYGDRDDREAKMAMGAIEDVSAKCIDFIGTFNVRDIAKSNGISFEHDVLNRLAEGG